MQRSLAVAAVAAVLGCAGTRPLAEPAPFSTVFAASLAWSERGTPGYDVAVALPHADLLAAADAADAWVRLVLRASVVTPGGDALGGEVWTRRIARADLASQGDLHWCVALATVPGPQRLVLTVLVQGRAWGTPWQRGFEVPAPGPAALLLGEPVFLAGSDAGGTAADSACNAIVVGRYYDAETGPPRLRAGVYDFAAPEADTTFVLSYVVHALDAPATERELPVAAGSLAVVRRGRVTTVGWELPSPPLGRYAVELRLQGASRSATASGHFEMGLVDLGALGSGAGDIELLELLLSPAAADSLRRVAPEAREALWNELWRWRDPEPATPANEARDAALARVRQANLRFGGARPGWQTDRGRVFVTHGAPDAVDTLRNPEGFDRIERWTYAMRNLVFVFVDREGRGDYELLRTNAPEY